MEDVVVVVVADEEKDEEDGWRGNAGEMMDGIKSRADYTGERRGRFLVGQRKFEKLKTSRDDGYLSWGKGKGD